MGGHDSDTKTTGSVRWLAVVCGLAVATGLQLAAPPSAVASPVTDWGSQADGPAGEIRNQMERLYSEMGAGNLNGAKAACRRLQSSAQSLRSMLPAPVPMLSAEIGMGANGLISASKDCINTGATPNKGQVATVKRSFDVAMMHLNNAQSIIDAG
jgi:hypothetical protein